MASAFRGILVPHYAHPLTSRPPRLLPEPALSAGKAEQPPFARSLDQLSEPAQSAGKPAQSTRSDSSSRLRPANRSPQSQGCTSAATSTWQNHEWLARPAQVAQTEIAESGTVCRNPAGFRQIRQDGQAAPTPHRRGKIVVCPPKPAKQNLRSRTPYSASPGIRGADPTTKSGTRISSPGWSGEHATARAQCPRFD